MKNELETQKPANTPAVKGVLAYAELSSGKLGKEREGRTDALPIIVLSSDLEFSTESHCQLLQIAALVPKPFSFEHLSHAIGRVLCASHNVGWGAAAGPRVSDGLNQAPAKVAEEIGASSKETAEAASIVAKPPGFQAASAVSCFWKGAFQPSEAVDSSSLNRLASQR